jgi:hypothetical protein
VDWPVVRALAAIRPRGFSPTAIQPRDLVLQPQHLILKLANVGGVLAMPLPECSVLGFKFFDAMTEVSESL